MTSRLLGQCARVLSRATPNAQAAAARLPASPAGATEPLWALAWSRSFGRPFCEARNVAKKEDFATVPKRTKLDELLEKAVSQQDILLAWAERGGNGNQAAKTMVRLSQGERGASGDKSDLLNDPRVKAMMDTVTGEIGTVWNGTLVLLLRSLSALNVPPVTPVVGSVQTEVLWRVRRLTYKQLAYLVDWGVGRKGQQEEKIVSAALKQLELRWTEISDTRSLSTLMARAGHLSPTIMDRLEDKALELVEGFSAEDIRRMCLAMASQSRRSVPLLRALSYHLLQKPSSDLTTPLLLDMAFAYGKLNFNHTQVFQRMASELLPRVPELSPVDVTRCAKSLAFLKWLHLPLFEAFIEHYIAKGQTYNTMQLCNLIMSLAKLGFQPGKVEFFKKAHCALDSSFSGLEPHLQTDVLWSLCALQQARPQYFTSLTHNPHLAKLSEDSPTRVENYRLKLLHIATTLQFEHPELTKTISFQLPVPSPTPPARISTLSPLQKGLKGALEGLVGGEGEALRTGVSTVYGWTIDGELVVDSENKPVNLVGLTAPHLPTGGGDTPLPAGARRLAFLAWEFPHFGSRSKDLLGRFTMMRRHLQLAGFITVQVPYFEWLELKSDRQKVAYLKDKMGKAVAEDMAK